MAFALAAMLGTASASPHDPPGPAGPGNQAVNGVLTSPFEDVTPPTFEDGASVQAAQQWLDVALAKREHRLGVLAKSISGSKVLPGAASSTLAGLVASDAAGIDGLVGSVASASSASALDQDAASMIVRYRVFAVVAPVVRTAIAAYSQLSSAAAIQSLEPAIGAAIATESLGASSTVQAKTLYRDLLAELGSVTTTDTAVAGDVLALGPTSFPGSSGVLSSASSSLAGSAARIASAQQDVRDIVKLLAAPGLVKDHVHLGPRG